MLKNLKVSGNCESFGNSCQELQTTVKFISSHVTTSPLRTFCSAFEPSLLVSFLLQGNRDLFSFMFSCFSFTACKSFCTGHYTMGGDELVQAQSIPKVTGRTGRAQRLVVRKVHDFQCFSVVYINLSWSSGVSSSHL